MAKLIKSYWRIRAVRYAVVGAILLLSVAVAYAASVPNTFTAGNTARASEVNANFSYLADSSWEKNGSNLYYSGGNVGIGTSSPNYLFHLAAPDATAIRLDRNGITIARIGDITVTSYGSLVLNDSAGNATFVFHGGAFSYINNGYNFGIGTATPSYPLHMGSGAHVTSGGVWTDASSRDYKENIQKLQKEDALAALKKLDPVTFTYKKDKGESYVGFIAEDVPELVATSDRKGLAPMDIVAVLTKVVKEQLETMEKMEKRIAELEAK